MTRVMEPGQHEPIEKSTINYPGSKKGEGKRH